MSVRSAVALDEGADEELLAKVDAYESSDLTEFQKAALSLADVYLGVPSATDDDLRAAECHGDLSLQICAGSTDTVLHALRDITRHTRGAMQIRWQVDADAGLDREFRIGLGLRQHDGVTAH